MKDIYIALTATPHLISHLIRKITGAKVSHVMIIYKSDTWGGYWAVEATKPIVMKVPAEKAFHHVHSMYRVEFDGPPALQAIREYIGNKYDYRSLALHLRVFLAFKFFKKRLKHIFVETKAQTCSELVMRFIKAAREKDKPLAGTEMIDPEATTPGDVLDYIEGNRSYFERIDHVEFSKKL